jgi:hypothetical protein
MIKFSNKKKVLLIFVLITFIIQLSGCGIKTPLYRYASSLQKH